MNARSIDSGGNAPGPAAVCFCSLPGHDVTSKKTMTAPGRLGSQAPFVVFQSPIQSISDCDAVYPSLVQ